MTTSLETRKSPAPMPGWRRKVLSAFLHTLPYSIVITVLLFFVAIYIHDAQCKRDVSQALRAAAALAAEWSNEAGDLVLVQSASGAEEWTASFRQAQPGYHQLLKQSQIAEVLDGSDLPYLRQAFAEDRSASDEIRQIAALVRQKPTTEEDAKQIVRQAAERMTAFSERLAEVMPQQQRQPILFKFQPKGTEELQGLAEEQVRLLGDKVKELRHAVQTRSAELASAAQADDGERSDRAVQLTAEVCHVSRVAFVLVSTLSAQTHHDSDLRTALCCTPERGVPSGAGAGQESSPRRNRLCESVAALEEYAASTAAPGHDARLRRALIEPQLLDTPAAPDYVDGCRLAAGSLLGSQHSAATARAGSGAALFLRERQTGEGAAMSAGSLRSLHGPAAWAAVVFLLGSVRRAAGAGCGTHARQPRGPSGHP